MFVVSSAMEADISACWGMFRPAGAVSASHVGAVELTARGVGCVRPELSIASLKSIDTEDAAAEAVFAGR